MGLENSVRFVVHRGERLLVPYESIEEVLQERNGRDKDSEVTAIDIVAQSPDDDDLGVRLTMDKFDGIDLVVRTDSRGDGLALVSDLRVAVRDAMARRLPYVRPIPFLAAMVVVLAASTLVAWGVIDARDRTAAHQDDLLAYYRDEPQPEPIRLVFPFTDRFGIASYMNSAEAEELRDWTTSKLAELSDPSIDSAAVDRTLLDELVIAPLREQERRLTELLSEDEPAEVERPPVPKKRESPWLLHYQGSLVSTLLAVLLGVTWYLKRTGRNGQFLFGAEALRAQSERARLKVIFGVAATLFFGTVSSVIASGLTGP